MPEYLSPGVYVEEIDSGPKPIEGVSTSVAAFVGFTERVPQESRQLGGKAVAEPQINTPILITSWHQYEENFGGFVEGAYLPHAVYGFFQNGGTRCYIISVQEMPRAQRELTVGGSKLLITSKKGGAEGSRLRVKLNYEQLPAPASSSPAAASSTATTGDGKDEDKDKKPATPAPKKPTAGANEPETFDLVVESYDVTSGQWRVAETLRDVSFQEVQENGKKKVEVAYQFNRGSRLVDIEVASEQTPSLAKYSPTWEQLKIDNKDKLVAAGGPELVGNVSDRTGIGSLEMLDDVSIVCVPDLMPQPESFDNIDLKMIKYVQDQMVSHCELMGDRVAVLDPLPNLSPQQVKDWKQNYLPDSSYATLYYPWLEVMDPVTRQPMMIPPSGHVAGIWARTDQTRGVHKAPANESVRAITGTAFDVTKREQDGLNPIGVNCIRTFAGRGTRVWGARTVSSNPSWRYLNVRRLFNFIEKSIERDTQWVVFEPNDHDLWERVKRDVTAFLRVVWRSGALFGLTEDEAFYVKCDADLNPPETRDLGRLYIEIGLAPVKPAEFVIFRIMQKNENTFS